MDIKTWAEWKEKLTSAFPHQQDFVEKLEVMLQHRKRGNESYTKYYYEKVALIYSCRFEGEEAVSCLIQGIENGMVRNTARAGKYHQLEKLFAYLGALVDGPSGTGTQSLPILSVSCIKLFHLSTVLEYIICF